MDAYLCSLYFVLPYREKKLIIWKWHIFDRRVQKFMNVLAVPVNLCDCCVIVSTMEKVWTGSRPDICAAPTSGVSSVTSVYSWQECCSRKFQRGFHIVSHAAVWSICCLYNLMWTILLDIDLISLTENICVLLPLHFIVMERVEVLKSIQKKRESQKCAKNLFF